MIVGIGLDLVDIARVARLLETKGDRARRRLFTEGELAYAERRAEPARHLAARFSAKEAAYKALAGTEHARGIGWHDIEVLVEWDGRPALRFHGRAAERAAELGITRAHLSLTHADTTAAAVVVLESDAAR
jgi:holo-[acyl-carrier protein] synthase